MLLSIGLMVRNEEKYLENCLKGLAPIVEAINSELIIVDTGSTDRTLEIARKFTDNVYEHEWTNDFAAMRNTVLSYTSGKWFFYVDGDEVLTDASGIIDFFVSNAYRKYNAAAVLIKNLSSTANENSYGIFRALRLFRNDEDFHFQGIVHEQPMGKGPIADIRGEIIHYGYLSDDQELMEYKFRRNVDLLEKALKKDPKNIYTLFQLSQSYAMYKDYQGALDYILTAYKYAQSGDPRKYIYVLNQLANLYNRNKFYVEAEIACKKGLKLKGDNIDLHYFQSVAQVELGKLEQAARGFERYLSLVNDFEGRKLSFDLTIDFKTIGEKENVYGALCGLYVKLGDPKKALGFGERIRNENVLKNSAPHLVDAYIKLGRLSELKVLFEKWEDNDGARLSLEKAIEERCLGLEKEGRQKLAAVFSDIDTTYGLLNYVRSDYYDGKQSLGVQLWEKLSEIDLTNSPIYYAEFLFTWIRYGHPIYSQVEPVRNDRLSSYVTYLNRLYEDFPNCLISHLTSEESWSTERGNKQEIKRLHTGFLYGLLRDNALDENTYRKSFKLYVQCGIDYIEASYTSEILDKALVSWVRNGADGFLLYMRLARNVDKSSVDYVSYLRLALAQDASMKKGIDLLLKEVREELENPEQNELNRLKMSVQDAIKQAINAGELETAVALISEYEDIAGLDAPLCAAKGLLFMIEGNLEKARRIFLAGLEFEPENEDLLYNLNYLDNL